MGCTPIRNSLPVWYVVKAILRPVSAIHPRRFLDVVISKDGAGSDGAWLIELLSGKIFVRPADFL